MLPGYGSYSQPEPPVQHARSFATMAAAHGILEQEAIGMEIPPVTASEVERILDLARWAPSGDNLQPWRFKILSSEKVIVTIYVDGEQRNFYDFANGHPTLLSAGFLLETMRIAASRFGYGMDWTYLGSKNTGSGSAHHTVEVTLAKGGAIGEDPLCPYITTRSVDRRPYRRIPLTTQQKLELEAQIGSDLRIEWRETLAARWGLSRLSSRSTDIRLRLPETYQVHKRILDWDSRFSPDRVPAAAVGVDPLTFKLMRFAMAAWWRVDFMNRFLWGTAIPRLELDLIPGIYCAAHFVLIRKFVPQSDDAAPDLLRTGGRLQRFWLTATRLGLAMQPALAPLCFADYARADTAPSSARDRIKKFAAKAEGYIPIDGSVLFLGRIGVPQRRPLAARSIRRNLADLMD